MAKGGKVSVSVPARSMTFLTTDYENHVPAAVTKIRIVNGRLGWAANEEPEHRYYRVYKDGKQIASTVATSLGVSDATSEDAPRFSVRSVDKWGGEGK